MAESFVRFDIQVRELCIALSNGVDHIIFKSSVVGLLDVIVEFARPTVPRFSPAPKRLMFGMDTSAWYYGRPEFLCGKNIPVGTVFSCPYPTFNDDEKTVACVVVVDRYECGLNDYRWIVGVIVPEIHVKQDGKYRYLNDMTDLGPIRPTTANLFAVHYVDVYCLINSYWDGIAQKYKTVQTPGGYKCVYKPVGAIPCCNGPTSPTVHLLPNEVPHYRVEQSLLSNPPRKKRQFV